MFALRRQAAISALRPVPRFAVPMSKLVFAHARLASTNRLTASEEQDLLVRQRKNRPLSPDLTIYKPQITMIMSGLHRITGMAMTGVFYAYIIAYAFLPYVGLGFQSGDVAALFGALPFALKFIIKLVLAAPFSFHSFNGLRHLLWDYAKYLTIPGVYKTGYIVTALTAVSTLALALM